MSREATAPLEEWMESIIDYRGKTPTKTDSGVPLVTAKIIKSGRIDTPSEFIAEEDYEKWMRRGIPKGGDVVITTEAPLGEVAQLPNHKIALAQRVITLRGKQGIVDNTYLKYLLLSSEFQHDLESRATGTTVFGIKQSVLRKIELSFPDFGEQKVIAHILGTLDGKIELNRKTNETLEAMAKALFKSWFVDFDPVRAKAEGRPTGLPGEISNLFPDSFEDSELGEIPSGWDVKTIGDIAEVIDCLHSKKPEKLDEGFLMLQLNNIRDDGLLDVGDQFLISENDYQKWTSRMEASEGDCVVTNVGRVGAVAQIPEGVKAALGRNMTGVRGKHTFKFRTFILEYLLSPLGREEIRINIDEGTILNALNVKSIPKLRFALPSGHLLEKYEVIGRSFRKRMEMLLLENSLLCDLRDALLPRLISGELRVPDAEKILEEAGV